ncbi:MAG TPA: hypothetical protein PLX41_07090 [Bacteroidales bacterium]|nr:hypothetical protein [Bacteroidales bacterium]
MKDLLATIRGHFFRLKCKIGRKNVFIGSGLRIYKKFSILGDGKIVMGKNCLIDGMIGSNNFVCIQTFNSAAGITIGDNVSLYAARIASKFNIVIGDDVIIEDASIVDTDFHTLDRSRATPLDENIIKNQIIIGDRVHIGAQTFITKGVVVGDDVITAPFSVVAKSVKPCQFAYGNPLVCRERGRIH